MKTYKLYSMIWNHAHVKGMTGLVLLLLLTLPSFLSAQTDSLRTVVVTVFDSETDEPIPGTEIRLVQFDSTGTETELAVGGATNGTGEVILHSPLPNDLALKIRSIGYEPALLRFGDAEDTVTVYLFPVETFAPVAQITGVRRSRSVEDGCCRVESIREEVQQHAPFSPSPVESLRRYSSCTSGRTINTIDNAGTISLRGLEPTRVGLLLDGVPVFTGLGTFYGLSMIPSHALQTIQIAEGASSSRYGNGAISGIVDLQTRVPTEEPELNSSINLLGESTTPDQYDLNAGYTGLIGDVGLAVFGSFNNHTVSLPNDGTSLDRDYRRFSGMVKGNALLDGRTEMIVTLVGGAEERTGTVQGVEQGTYRHELDLGQMTGIASVSRLVGDQGEIAVKGAVSGFSAEGDLDGTGLDATQTILYGEGVWSDLAGIHDYQIGLQGRSDKLRGETGNDIGYDYSIFSLFAQDAIPVGSKWTLLGSLRADQHSDAGFLLSPRGSIRYAISDGVSMRLMAGQGFKGEATFDEDYRTVIGSVNWRPNPEAGFERSFTVNYDISWNWAPFRTVAGSGNLNFYYTGIADKLLPNPDSLAAGTLFYENSADPARLLGLEWQTRASIEGGWSASLAVALIDYRLMTADGEWERLPFSPQVNIDGALTWYREDIGLTMEGWGSLIGPQRLPYEINGKTTSPAYGLVNGRIEKSLGSFAIFAGVLNLLDARQDRTMPLVQIGESTPDGSIGWGPAEGREMFLGVRMRLGWGLE